MAEVFKDIQKNGLPYRIPVSDRCKYLIEWCLQQDPNRRPTCLELLNFIVTSNSEKGIPPTPSKKSINIVSNNYMDTP